MISGQTPLSSATAAILVDLTSKNRISQRVVGALGIASLAFGFTFFTHWFLETFGNNVGPHTFQSLCVNRLPKSEPKPWAYELILVYVKNPDDERANVNPLEASPF